MTTVGIIGLGAIGRAVANASAGAGLAVVGCDVDPAATGSLGDGALPTPAAVGVAADLVVVAVVDDAQVRAVIAGPDGLLSGSARATTVLVLSTISPSTLHEVADLAAGAGITVLDCGVTGGPAAAARGELVAMIGGDASALEQARPVLDACTATAVHVGPLGSGMQAKLARNLVQYAAWLAAYEGQRLAEAAGVPLDVLAELIRAGDRTTGGLTALMWRPTVTPFGDGDDAGLVDAMRNAATLARKDLRAAIALGEELGCQLPLAEMTEARCDAVFGVGPDQ